MTALTSNQPAHLIRWMTHADVSACFQLGCRHGGEDFWEYEQIQDLPKAYPSRGLLALDAETSQLLGMLFYHTRERDNRIQNIVVHKEHRGQGIAAKLIESLAALKGEASRPNLSVVVRETDLAMQLYLKRRGFICTRMQANIFDCPPEAGCLFLRRLG